MPEEWTLSRVFRALGRQWLPIVLAPCVLAALTVAYGLTRAPVFRARVGLRVHSPRVDFSSENLLAAALGSRRDFRREFLLLGRTPAVARRAAEELKPPAEALPLLRRVSLRPDGVSDILIEAFGPTEQAASDLALAWGRALEAEVALRYDRGPDSLPVGPMLSRLKEEAVASELALSTFEAATGTGTPGAAAADEARRRMLILERDLAADAVRAASRKVVELRLQQAVDPTGVELAASSLSAGRDTGWPLRARLAVALASGLVLGFWIAVLRERGRKL